MLIDKRDQRLIRAIHRYQHHRDARGLWARLQCARGKLGHEIWSLLSGSDINREADLAANLRMPHPTGIVMHRNARVGANCLIMQHVTLGEIEGGKAPQISDDVYIGAGARILGGVTIGKGARIGANAVVLQNVPAGATAVGVPARILTGSKQT
ncbi:MAG: DapH/DapD/GlmU-related protein [Sulfitobacter pontiacus]|uniref:serine O-acetyltransferase n=1 Tax=Roseobacteraceae TaxID=2854170 RepID=UPI003273A09C